jgi:hypothetical protein
MNTHYTYTSFAHLHNCSFSHFPVCTFAHLHIERISQINGLYSY